MAGYAAVFEERGRISQRYNCCGARRLVRAVPRLLPLRSEPTPAAGRVGSPHRHSSLVGTATADVRGRARASRASSNFLNAPFFWPGLIQADIALPVILCRLGWTLCEWSGRRDSNPRSLGPEPSAIPGFATSRRLEFSARCTVHSVPRSRTESQFEELHRNCENFTPSITPA